MKTFIHQPILRKAGLHDAEILSRLCSETFSDTYASQNKSSDIEFYIQNNFNQQKITEELNQPETVFYLVFEKDSPIAYIKLLQCKNKMEISRFYVKKEYFGKGIAQILIKTAKEYTSAKALDTLYLVVWQKNLRAVAFYKKCGFIITGNTIFDWGTGKLDDDFEMELKL